MNTDFINTVENTITRNALLNRGDRVIVAISGGADSVCLLTVLQKLGYECICAHCNYHLRGEESNRDMHHVKKICDKTGITLLINDFNVEKERLTSNESIEMVCRRLRYDWFEQLRLVKDAAAIATGHHREDNIETMFLNLFRGTGIDGLKGMRYKRDNIIRPLLDVSRKQIEDFLNDNKIGFINDSSNSSDDFLRNRVRNHILPAINRFFPDAERSILATMENISSTANLLQRDIENYRQQTTCADGRIDLTKLISLTGDSASTALYLMIRGYGFTSSQCQDIIAAYVGSGLKFISKTHYIAELDRSKLRIADNALSNDSSEEFETSIDKDILKPIHICVTRHDIADFIPADDRQSIYLDISALDENNHWKLRHYKKGDRIKAYGLKGSKLLSDIFTEAKFSADDKRQAWILTCNDEPVWVIGLRTSRLFNINPSTKEYIQLTLT